VDGMFGQAGKDVRRHGDSPAWGAEKRRRGWRARRPRTRAEPGREDDAGTTTDSTTHRPFARDTPPHRWLEGRCGRSPGSRLDAFRRLPGRGPVAKMGGTLADDSCGGSSGFQAVGLAPDSLLIPMGTINGRQSRLAEASASRSI
jgi:hypothetical protein